MIKTARLLISIALSITGFAVLFGLVELELTDVFAFLLLLAISQAFTD